MLVPVLLWFPGIGVAFIYCLWNLCLVVFTITCNYARWIVTVNQGMLHNPFHCIGSFVAQSLLLETVSTAVYNESQHLSVWLNLMSDEGMNKKKRWIITLQLPFGETSGSLIFSCNCWWCFDLCKLASPLTIGIDCAFMAEIMAAISENWAWVWLETDSRLLIHAYFEPAIAPWDVYNCWLNCGVYAYFQLLDFSHL